MGSSLTVAGISIASNSASADRSRRRKGKGTLPNEDKIREEFRQEYGKEAAVKALKVIKSEYQKLQSREDYTKAEFEKRVTARLKKDELTHPIAVKHERVSKQAEQVKQDLNSKNINSDSVTTQSKEPGSSGLVSTQSSGNKVLAGYRTATNSNNAAYSGAEDIRNSDDILPIMGLNAHAYLYGSAWAEMEQYTTFTPSETGTWDFGFPYVTVGRITGGNVEVVTYKSPKESTEEIIPTLSSNPDQSGQEWVSFDLEEGTEYEIGARAIVSVDGTASESYVDFKTPGDLRSDRHIAITTLEYNSP